MSRAFVVRCGFCPATFAGRWRMDALERHLLVVHHDRHGPPTRRARRLDTAGVPR